jgi:hypothetical protein
MKSVVSDRVLTGIIVKLDIQAEFSITVFLVIAWNPGKM